MPSKWCSASQIVSQPNASASCASRKVSSMTAPSRSGSRLSGNRKSPNFMDAPFRAAVATGTGRRNLPASPPPRGGASGFVVAAIEHARRSVDLRLEHAQAPFARPAAILLPLLIAFGDGHLACLRLVFGDQCRVIDFLADRARAAEFLHPRPSARVAIGAETTRSRRRGQGHDRQPISRIFSN